MLAKNRKFHGIAANFAVLHIGLGGYGSVYEYGNGFPAIRTLEKMFDHPGLKIYIQQLPTYLKQL